METLLSALLSYLISLAANLRTDAIHKRREENILQELEREEALRKALASCRSLRDELRSACVELARNRDHLGVTPQEEPLWRLLSDDVFQADLVEWLMAGSITEGNDVKDRLIQAMEGALAASGASPEKITFLKTSYFEAIDKVVFAHPILAHWRHQLSLDYLREQVVVLRQRADEAAGVYTADQQQSALDRYCEKALATWDIIDLSNLPEGDIHMATQKLLLRQLYMPLRITVEPANREEGDDAALARLEKQRQIRRQQEAGLMFADERDRPRRPKSRLSVGECLQSSQRLVVLGDPGGGKTTMLRWMATAYLLRRNSDSAFNQIPDTQTLPDHRWIPVLIRCRDIGPDDLCRCFTDFLRQHLHKTELLPEEADVMRAVILDRIAKGKALLLVDGLDEITNPNVRTMFCQELERTAARYPHAPIVVTSRIVGYRDMPYRMGSGFEHGIIAELNREDKDLFSQRWIEVTEQHKPTAEKAKLAQELIDALHSSDRIQRLTGNPMLLTTLALVKRKVGKLPNRRNKLYAEAVSVMLNWNPRLYQTIEEDEAIPQLEYLAYEMCRRGVQRLTNDEILDLLDKLRTEYPNIRAIRSREPQAFLELLEARSSILIKSGSIFQKDTAPEQPIWEFRHLTFQEYLAARALSDGRYQGRDKTMSLAEQVAPLAGSVEESNRPPEPEEEVEVEVSESWREALRLLVADCKDDDVDDVLLAILTPMAGEDAGKTGRPRAVLAALCLADEPNISKETVEQVLAAFASKVSRRDGECYGFVASTIDTAAKEIGGSMWALLLKKYLIGEYCQRSQSERRYLVGLWGMVEFAGWARSGLQPSACFEDLLQRIQSGDLVEELSAACTAMYAAYKEKAVVQPGLIDSLFGMLRKSPEESYAAAIALLWLNGGRFGNHDHQIFWRPSSEEIFQLVVSLEQAPRTESIYRYCLAEIIRNVGYDKSLTTATILITNLSSADEEVRRAVATALGQLGDKQAVKPLLGLLDDPEEKVRLTVIAALGQLGDKQAVKPLLGRLDDPEVNVRCTVVATLGQLGDKQAVKPLLGRLDDPKAELRCAVVAALGQLGDKQAVKPLLSRLDNHEAEFRRIVVAALGQLGDKQAVKPLLGRLADPKVNVRRTVVEALGQLGDKQAVKPLLGRLADPKAEVRYAVVAALGQLGDKQAVDPLVRCMEDQDDRLCVAAAGALAVLEHDSDQRALADFLDHSSPERRKAAVGELARKRSHTDRILLSRDLDATTPWIDPREMITEDRIASVAKELNVTTEEAHSIYQTLVTDFHLRMG